jgi:hypothetical protein
MVAIKESDSGYGAIMINATINNRHAGTFKLSTNNFFLTASNSRFYQPVGGVFTSVSDNDHYNWFLLPFQLDAGATPTTLRYYDGTHDLSCTVT